MIDGIVHVVQFGYESRYTYLLIWSTWWTNFTKCSLFWAQL